MFNPELENEERREMMINFIPVIVCLAVSAFITSYGGYALM